jgi:hypothetical protein
MWISFGLVSYRIAAFPISFSDVMSRDERFPIWCQRRLVAAPAELRDHHLHDAGQHRARHGRTEPRALFRPD